MATMRHKFYVRSLCIYINRLELAGLIPTHSITRPNVSQSLAGCAHLCQATGSQVVSICWILHYLFLIRQTALCEMQFYADDSRVGFEKS
mmetsp:Transcript_7975/g.23779  ORF Transcript_7975/g.23779 Transcript_7975/m.23779 type:complete len:90 (-) Transcript_7975:188-457(-)